MTTAEAVTLDVPTSEWEWPLYYPKRYKVLYGGRSSGKTWAVAKALVIQSHQERHVIYCVREHLKSLSDSAKPAIEGWIQRLGLAPWFTITRDQIVNNVTGSVFRFAGLSVVSEEDIKGWEGVTRCWAEEAHTMSHRSRELLYPTVFRQPNSEFWATFNPKNRYDPIYMDFVSGNWGDGNRYVRKVNYYDNPHFPEAEDELRREFKANQPLRYSHIWLGDPDDAAAERKVLPYSLLRTCVEMWGRKPTRGAFGVGGFDVADTGADWNALTLRYGPELHSVQRWRGSEEYTISNSSRRAVKACVDNGVQRLNYDAGGVGAGVRGPAREYIRDNKLSVTINGCSFGGKVQAPQVIFMLARPKSLVQDQYFANWGSQAGFVLRQRADQTQRLANGEPVNPGTCLFVNPSISALEDILADLSQAEWTDEPSGKYRIEKQPREAGQPKPPSPDCFDSLRLSYATDARRGLKATS